MIFIAAALYEEGMGFIEKYKLKKDLSYSHIQVFKNNEIILIICKSGMIQSAVGATEVFSKENANENDLFFNIGICGCKDKSIRKGEIFLINKITDMTTGKNYYADILYRHNFKENSINTFPVRVSGDIKGNFKLCDMESAALYQSAVKFFGNDRIFFIKIVSDYCDENIEIKEIKRIIKESENNIFKWIDDIKNNEKDIEVHNECSDEIEDFCEMMKFSEYMKKQASRLLMYYSSENGNVKELIEEFISDNNIDEIKNKREGKIYLEKLRKKIIQ